MIIAKMHGLGNDFLITEEQPKEIAQIAKKLCHRRFGIGADGLMVVCPSNMADIKMRIFNADGSEAEMCGNGIRCFAKYVYEEGIVPKENMTIETLAGIMKPTLTVVKGEVTQIKVDMGLPCFDKEKIPVNTENPLDFDITVLNKTFNACSVLMGVPHTVIFCDSFTEEDVEIYGKAIECLPIFSKKTNVNFATVIGKNQVKIGTWERGAGSTYACGTGATAVGVMAYKKGLTQSIVTIKPKIEQLIIENTKEGVFMTGSAQFIFKGLSI